MTKKTTDKDYENKCPECSSIEIDWDDVEWVCKGKEIHSETDYDYPSELSLRYNAVCKMCGCHFTSWYSLSFEGMKVNV